MLITALAIGGTALLMQPDPQMLRRLFEERLAQCEKTYGLLDRRTAGAARDLGLFLRGQGDHADAQKALAETLSIDEKVLGGQDGQTFADAADLATVSSPDAAQALWERAAHSSDAAVASQAFAALGELSEQADHRAAAVAYYREALEKEEAVAGKNAARVAVRLNALALVSEPAAAIALLERALAIDRTDWGEKHPETATTEANLSSELLAIGRVEEAIRIGNLALTNFEATLGPEHPRTAAAASNLADAFSEKGDAPKAEHLYRLALSIDERAYGKSNPETLNDVRKLADFLRQTGRSEEAAELEREFAINGTN